MENKFCHIFWSNTGAHFTPCYLIVWLNSIISLQKQNGTTYFIGDKNTTSYLKQLGFLDLYDHIDDITATKSLQEHNIDFTIFPAFAKFAALEKYPNSCIVDNDLVLRKDLSRIISSDRALFTHYEICPKPTIWYPKKEDLGIREGYTFPEEWNFNLNAVNTSIIYLGNDELRHYVAEQAWDYMSGNTKKSLGKAEFIFVEQSLIPMCCKLFNVPIETVIDSIWNAQKGQFILSNGKNNPHKKAWNNYYAFDNSSPVTHTWIAKKYIEANPAYRDYMCCRGLELIAREDKEIYKMCEQIPEFQPYISMLEQGGSTKRLVKTNRVTNKLFKDS